MSGNPYDRVGGFVKAGQAAQVAVDKLTGADRARAAVDAATVSSRLVRVRQALDDAIAHGERGDWEMHRDIRRARTELLQLGAELAAHFERFTDGQG